ncbi:unnamed protein product [Urochloa humidicola]
MASSGGDVPRSRAQESNQWGHRRSHQAASLPLDVMADIAARSDPVMLVRCAATCIDMRERVADPAFHRRLRLRHADRFVPSLLRGHLLGKRSYKINGQPNDDERVYLVDTPAAGATVRLLPAGESFPPGQDGEPWRCRASCRCATASSSSTRIMSCACSTWPPAAARPSLPLPDLSSPAATSSSSASVASGR